MSGNRRQPPLAASAPAPPSPTAKGTAKYTNKDGSKFITVPKTSTPSDSCYPTQIASGAIPQASADEPTQPVNRKKQKRRAKAAAKAAAEHPNGLPSPPASHENRTADADVDDSEEEDGQRLGYGPQELDVNGFQVSSSSKKKTKKKRKKNNSGADSDNVASPRLDPTQGLPVGTVAPAQVHRPISELDHRGPGITKEKLWNTSNQEERERIKEFWLGLGEDERKSLVKVEKDAVLRKMKEQQRHTCSCTVCGRKRTAIEEELEGLYDSYYRELESFANQPNNGEVPRNPPMMGSTQSLVSIGGVSSRPLSSSYGNARLTHEPTHDEQELEEEDVGGEFSEDDVEEDEYSDGPSEDMPRRDYASEFFTFGSHLTVQQGGILTVADDLLKNDGKKFIEMMEQLAERRMAREEDAREQFERTYDHANAVRFDHTQPPAEEDEYDDEGDEYEEEEEEDYDSQEDEDHMTDEQRMEEGRRMFQIFAARMFEQRVLTAYREKVAKERQKKLLEELEDETRLESERKAKKAKEALKKKEKLAKKKVAEAEEKARREQEKAAEEAARQAEEARKAEESRLKAEEKRKKKEAQKKAEEEERRRKEADRLRRIQEQQDIERKARERSEREKKAKEEAVRAREKEARERKEREAREKREQQERKAKQDSEKREREAQEAKTKAKPSATHRDTKEKRKQDEKVAQKVAALNTGPSITLAKRPAQHAAPAPAVPALPQSSVTGAHPSPRVPIATPALPKAPSLRQRQGSQQEVLIPPGHRGTQPGPAPGPQRSASHSLTPLHTSPAPGGSVGGTSSTTNGTQHSSQATSPLNASATPFGGQPSPFTPQMSTMPFTPNMPQPPPGFGIRFPGDFQPMGSSYRPPPGISIPPGLNGPMSCGRGLVIPHPGLPPGFGFPQPPGLDGSLPGSGPGFSPVMSKESPLHGHSRQASSGFDASPQAPHRPIGPPGPIGRPGSVSLGQRRPSGSPSSSTPHNGLDDHRLGSSALLDDLDDPILELPAARRGNSSNMAPGPRPMQPTLPTLPFGDPIFGLPHNLWAPPPPGAFGSSPPPPPGFNNVAPGPWGGMSQNSAFSPAAGPRPFEPNPVSIRKLVCRACSDLTRTVDGEQLGHDGFFSLNAIKARVDKLANGGMVSEEEISDICETEGTETNGGGSFDVKKDPVTKEKSIRFVAGNLMTPGVQSHRPIGARGDLFNLAQLSEQAKA